MFWGYVRPPGVARCGILWDMIEGQPHPLPQHPEVPSHTWIDESDVVFGEDVVHTVPPDGVPTEEQTPRVSLRAEPTHDTGGTDSRGSDEAHVVDVPLVPRTREPMPIFAGSSDWLDARLDFFDAYPDAEIPVVSRLVARADHGLRDTSGEMRAAYRAALTQYGALREVLQRALTHLNVTMPSVEEYRGAIPNDRRSFETQILQRIREYPSVNDTYIASLMTRLTVLTETVSAYEEAAEELEISLDDEAGDSELSAAK